MNTQELTKEISITLKTLSEKYGDKNILSKELRNKIELAYSWNSDEPIPQAYTDGILELCENRRVLVADIEKLERKLTHLKNLRQELSIRS